MKQYTLCREDGSIIGIMDFETQPQFSTEKLYQGGFLSPKLNFETDEFYEGATDEEIILKIRNEIPETPLWRIRAVLKMMGQEDNIAVALASLPEPMKTGAEYIWNYGTVIERNSQTVLFLQYVLQMTDLQVDEIFIQANNIQI